MLKFKENLKQMGWGYASLAGGILTLAGLLIGLLLTPYGFILCGLGCFGPLILREMGILKDKDEFQRQAERIAATKAFIACLGTIFLLAILHGSGQLSRELLLARDLWLCLLALGLVVYYISYAAQFWDGHKAASRILCLFGIFWGGFIILSEWGKPLSMLIEATVVVAPFVVLALLAGKYPRVIGTLTIGLDIFFFFFFHLYRSLGHGSDGLFLVLVLILPLLSAGLLLLTDSRE